MAGKKLRITHAGLNKINNQSRKNRAEMHVIVLTSLSVMLGKSQRRLKSIRIDFQYLIKRNFSSEEKNIIETGLTLMRRE